MFRWEETNHQKPFIGLIGAGQMADVFAVPAAAGETLQVFWMGRLTTPLRLSARVRFHERPYGRKYCWVHKNCDRSVAR